MLRNGEALNVYSHARVQAAKARRVAARVKRSISRSYPERGSIPVPRLLDAGDRLVPSPIFLYSSERSGSTLLRMILDSHSQICAPHELHLRTLRANFANWYGETAWRKLGVTKEQLADLLWDRLLHLMLTRTGKPNIVDKTPANLNIWARIAKSWPDARYIFLKRHPLRMAESLAAASPKLTMQEHYERINTYLDAWFEARAALPGITVSYEELTDNPERVVRGICDYLGVTFEPNMLDYRRSAHTGDFRRGLGDWNAKIKSGVIHAASPMPEAVDIPSELREACIKLGYL